MITKEYFLEGGVFHHRNNDKEQWYFDDRINGVVNDAVGGDTLTVFQIYSKTIRVGFDAFGKQISTIIRFVDCEPINIL